MEMEGFGSEGTRQLHGRQAEASLSRQISFSATSNPNLTKDEQQQQSTATNETKRRKDDEGDDEGKKKKYGNVKEGGNLFSINSVRRPAVSKAELEAVCARHCRVVEDGTYQWDLTKLKCLLSPDELNDLLLVRNLIHGMIITAQVHPLIFETSSEEDHEMVRLRSLSFFNQLLADSENGAARYQSLSNDQKLIVAVGVRDLFLGSWHGMLNEQEKHILDGMVKILDETVGCFQAMGMNLSFYPSACFTVVKLIEALDDEVGDEWAPFFAQVMHTPKLFVVFVDPAELSFYNFENIVPLDRWIEWKLENEPDGELTLSLEDARQVQVDREVLTCKLRGPACHLVKQLPSLDLYVAPLNKATRGGERFIFHSALLSKALSEAIRSSDVLSKLAQGQLTSSFEFVNYVFRCNKFVPGDALFASHLDTPYYDSARCQVSKYTLLIYLTAGRSESALRVSDVELNEIDEMTCVIFDQSCEHEGKPFIEGDKIFLRSELVFNDTNLKKNSQIASLFSEACYMTCQSVLDDGLASYAHECFERANSLHWAIEREATQPPVYFHKEFRDIHFVTNGYYYWFPKGSGVDVVDCGMVAVLDYFNCKIDGEPFRSLCHTTTVRKKFGSMEDIWENLLSGNKEKTEALRRLKKTDVESLIKNDPDKPFVKRPNELGEENEDGDEEEDEEGEICCRRCDGSRFNAWKSSHIQDTYRTCCYYTRKKLFGVPLLVLNQELVINEANIKVVGDKMFFLQESNRKPLPLINFASCWNRIDAYEFIDVDQKISAPQLLIPPIMLQEFSQGYQLMLDFFRNDWMVQVDDEHMIPVPIISNEETAGERPFMSSLPHHQFDYYVPFDIPEVVVGLDGERGGVDDDGWEALFA